MGKEPERFIEIGGHSVTDGIDMTEMVDKEEHESIIRYLETIAKLERETKENYIRKVIISISDIFKCKEWDEIEPILKTLQHEGKLLLR